MTEVSFDLKKQIILTFDGALAPNHTVSLRTLSYTMPHFQRAIDKVVLYEVYGEVRKYSTLPAEFYSFADLYVRELEKGSLKIPFLSDLIAGVPELYNDFMRQPYSEAAHEVAGYTGILKADLETNKIHASKDNLDVVTQEELLAREGERKQAYAQAAVMKDMSMALGLVRATEGALLNVKVDSQFGAMEYEFDQAHASRFAKLATTKRLADAIVYKGRITGLEKQRGNAQFTYAAKFLSATTNKESKILVSDYDDALKLHPYNLANAEIEFWGSPISIYNAYDPVRGDIVFIDIFHGL